MPARGYTSGIDTRSCHARSTSSAVWGKQGGRKGHFTSPSSADTFSHVATIVTWMWRLNIFQRQNYSQISRSSVQNQFLTGKLFIRVRLSFLRAELLHPVGLGGVNARRANPATQSFQQPNQRLWKDKGKISEARSYIYVVACLGSLDIWPSRV